MEIINYVGAGSAVRRRSPSKSFLLKTRAGSFDFSQVKERLHSVKFASIPRVQLPVIRTRHISRILIAALFCSFTFITMYRAIGYFQSFAGPVKFADAGDTEIEFLNSAMDSFAMDRTDVQFDENGNVLADDGSVLTMSSLGITKVISYQNYKVKSGDTISSIALKFGLTNISTLISVNDIENVRTLRAGQKLRIPNQDGISISVSKGQSLTGLSAKYNVSLEEILDANDLSSRTLAVGQELFIPGAKMDSGSLRKAMGELFSYPIKDRYRLTSLFGPRADPFTGVRSNHTGVDMACPTGTPIYSAMSGKVVYVGWSNIFGNYVIINHGNGYQSLYGHMSKTLCRTGKTVAQGAKIGLVGSTGYSTGPHLHFTVYKNGKLVDPMTLLKR
ncbi:MAG: M23 family metallopeptidase [Treponema sp.]|nr:M23 family metallopeptidase [Treponema sp.]